MFQFRLRKKRKAAPFRTKKRRTTPHFSNSPLAELYYQKAMWVLAYELSVWNCDLVVNSKELIGCLEGFVNDDSPKGASEFHYRVRCAWQDEDFVHGVWFTWVECPAMVEGLSKYSKKCAAEERVAAMKQDPAMLHILKAAKSDKLPRNNNYATLRGLFSILFVYWNDGDDLEKLFRDSKIKEEVGTTNNSLNEMPLEEFLRKIQTISYMANGPDDVQDLEKVLKSTHSDDPDYAATIFEKIGRCQRERLNLFGETKREKPIRIEVAYDPCSIRLRSGEQATNLQ